MVLRAVKEAPDFLSRLRDALHHVVLVLTYVNAPIRQQDTIGSLRSSTEYLNALRRCWTTMMSLDSFVKELKVSLSRQYWIRRKWTSFKTVFRKENIENLQDQVREARASLEFAHLLNVFPNSVRL